MRWFLKLFGFIPESPIASSNGGPDAELSAARKARASALARVCDAERRGDDRGLGRARMEAEALTRTELMLTVGR